MFSENSKSITCTCNFSLSAVATLTWEIQKVIFNNATNTYFWLCYLRIKQTVTVTVNLPTIYLKNVTALSCEM